ncbi:DUF6155 family protein [Anaerosolibacter sp.]|uniref:DUF6155 family protein n=1 Tax=Anaerosolibacter sp. TaxID=1872527 RepID=UPI0039EF6C88
MAKPTLIQMKKYLDSKTDVELREEILQLMKLFPNVREYYAVRVNSDEDEIMEKYKKIIRNEFFPNRGFGKLRYSVMKKALDDFKKISSNPVCIAELMITYVESGVEFTNAYGDIDEIFYTKIENMYDKVLDHISQNNLENIYGKRLSAIKDRCMGIGWGFEDIMVELYYDYFSDDED